MNTLYQQLIDTLQCAKIKPLADSTCCKLLAILYVFGGNREEFTHHNKFLADINYAQKRLNISGGEIPNWDLIPELQKYIKELTPDGIQDEWRKPQWALKLMGRYDITL